LYFPSELRRMRLPCYGSEILEAFGNLKRLAFLILCSLGIVRMDPSDYHPQHLKIVMQPIGGKYMRFSLTDYIDSAMSYAQYDKLEDGAFAGRIPKCKGVIAFTKSLRECENLLRSVLEDWIIVGLKLGHHLPVINGINLNRSA